MGQLPPSRRKPKRKTSTYRASAERLRQEGAVAVVTGQQAGLAGGPLYTLYKAESAVAEAVARESAEPESVVVPVFWIEGDDHDFDEVRGVGLLDPSGEYHRIMYGEADERRISIARRPVDPDAFERFLDELFAALGTTDFSEKTRQGLRDAYLGPLADGAEGPITLVDGFARYLYDLLGETTPLVLLSSNNRRLKGLATERFIATALDVEQHHDAVVAQTEALRVAGEVTPITPRAGHLFLQHDQERTPLDVEGEGYRLRGTDRTMTRQEVATIAQERPEDLSPNVMLRPIVQDTILPTILYVGGPTEVAYLRQLALLYEAHGVVMPQVVRRASKLIVEPKVERALAKSGQSLEVLLPDDFDAAVLLVDEEQEGLIDAAAGLSRTELAAIFARLADLASTIDPSLTKAAGAAGARATKELESTIGRLKGSLKRQRQTDIDRLESAHALLKPRGNPQERQLAAPYYRNRFGRDIPTPRELPI